MNIDWKVILSVAKSYADSKNNADYDANNGWDVESWHGFYVDSMISQIKKLFPPPPLTAQPDKPRHIGFNDLVAAIEIAIAYRDFGVLSEVLKHVKVNHPHHSSDK